MAPPVRRRTGRRFWWRTSSRRGASGSGGSTEAVDFLGGELGAVSPEPRTASDREIAVSRAKFTGAFQRIQLNDGPVARTLTYVTCAVVDADGNFWVGTEVQGL